jgi:hypothetical protein
MTNKSLKESVSAKIFKNFKCLIPGKDFTPWVYAFYRVNKRVLTRKIGQFRVTLRDITP